MNLSMKCFKKLEKIANLTHHEIRKNIVNAIACETSKAIIKDLDNGFFSRDILVKEQMVVVLHYVNKKKSVIEWFLGIAHVVSTVALSLKYAVESLLCEHNLSLSSLHRQGYDITNNM